MERVGHVDPGADAGGLGETGDEGEREGGAAGAFGSGEFGDGPDGEAAAECVVEGGDAGGSCRTDDARGGCERGGDAVGEGSFDLEAEHWAEGMIEHLRLIFAYASEVMQGGYSQVLAVEHRRRAISCPFTMTYATQENHLPGQMKDTR